MLIRKFSSRAATALAVVAFAGWASSANAAIPDDVNAALGSGSQAQKTAAIQSLAVSNATNSSNFGQLVQLVASGATQQQAGAFAGALGAACGASGNNAATTQAIVSTLVGAFPEAGGAITGAVISAGCSAEVAANTLQQSLLTAAGQSLSLTPVLPNTNPGPGVNLLQEAFVKSLNTTRLGNVSGEQVPQQTPMSPTEPNREMKTYNPEAN